MKNVASEWFEPMVLDLGCGNDKLPGAVGVDKNPRSAADVVHDLDVFPWPFESDTFEYVRAHGILEHVQDFIRSMDEIHRVCDDGAVIHVRLPFMTSPHLATDPTHRRAGTSRTFAYFDPRRVLGKSGYSAARLELLSVHYERGYPLNRLGLTLIKLDRHLIPFLERHAEEYEHFFAGVYPMHNVCYELRVHKAR